MQFAVQFVLVNLVLLIQTKQSSILAETRMEDCGRLSLLDRLDF